MLARKDKVVKELTDGVRHLFRKNRIEVFSGTARLSSPQTVEVALNEGGRTEVSAGHILLATGSEPVKLPFLPFDGKTVVDSTGALAFTRVPNHLVVVGAGYIGLELGSVWKRLGAKVTVLEFLPRIVPSADAEMGELLKKSLSKQGLEFHLETKVTGASIEGDRATVRAEKKDGSQHNFRVRSRAGRRRPPPADRRPRPGGGRRLGRLEDRQGAGRRAVPHERPDDLGDRRLDRRPDAGPQGRGRRHRLQRAAGRQVRSRRLQHGARRHLHLARTGQRGAHGRASEGARPELPRRQVPVRRQRPSQGDG